MQAFFQSKVYANFWVFVLKCALVVGLLAAIAMSLLAPSFFSAIFIYVFLIAFCYGFVTGALGFVAVFWLSRIVKSISPNLNTLGVGIFLALMVFLIVYPSSGFQIPLTPKGILFLGVPFIVSIAAFVRLCRKHVLPFV